MVKIKKDNAGGEIFSHSTVYSGLIVELTSDSTQLIKIDFLKKLNKTAVGSLPQPIESALSFLDDYFRGIEPDINIRFITGSSHNSSIKSGTLLLDMKDYTDREILVYTELVKVKTGSKISYGELASRSGVPRGARFAGNCMAKNRFPVIIPCHRVIKIDGSLGNYSGGVDIKIMLLEHEAKR